MIRAGRPIRSRMDYYAASADPGRQLPGGYDVAQQGVFRSSRSVEEMRRRPEALRTGYGNLRPVGMSAAYIPGMGKPSIEREDFDVSGSQQEDFWSQRGTEGTAEEQGYQPGAVRRVRLGQ